MLREQDVVTTWEPDGDAGFILTESTCPFRDVAAEHRAICIMDTALIGRLTGMRAVLRSAVAAGAERCVYQLTPQALPAGGRSA